MKKRKKEKEQSTECSREQKFAKDRQRRTERASFRLIRPAIRKMLKENESVHIVITKLHHPRLAFAPLLSLSLFNVQYYAQGDKSKQVSSSYDPSCESPKEKNTVISLFSMPSSIGSRFRHRGTFDNIICISHTRREGQGIKNTEGLRGSNVEDLSLLLLSASLVVVLSHCKRNAFEKADAGEESGSGKLQSHRNDCSATLVPVRAYLERRRDASTRERARLPL